MKRLVGAAGVATALCIGAGTANAQFRQAEPTIEVNPTTVAAGGTVVVTVDANCVDGASITIAIEPAGDSSAAFCAVGRYVERLTAPSRPATYDVIADGPGLSVQTRLTVTAAPDGLEPPLPNTGADDAASVAVLGAVLVVGGSALCGMGRARRRRFD